MAAVADETTLLEAKQQGGNENNDVQPVEQSSKPKSPKGYTAVDSIVDAGELS